MAPHLLRYQAIAVGDCSFTLGCLEAGAPATFDQLGFQINFHHTYFTLFQSVYKNTRSGLMLLRDRIDPENMK